MMTEDRAISWQDEYNAAIEAPLRAEIERLRTALTRIEMPYKPVAIHFEDSDVLEYVNHDGFCTYHNVDPDLAIIKNKWGVIIGFRLARFSKLRR